MAQMLAFLGATTELKRHMHELLVRQKLFLESVWDSPDFAKDL